MDPAGFRVPKGYMVETQVGEDRYRIRLCGRDRTGKPTQITREPNGMLGLGVRKKEEFCGGVLESQRGAA